MILALLMLAGFLKAFKDGVAFRPSRSRLAHFMPNFFGPNNWRWPYHNGDPNEGRRYSVAGQAIRTPFRSGWHMLDDLQRLCYTSSITIAAHWPWYISPALWLLHQLCFTSIWKTPITEKKP